MTTEDKGKLHAVLRLKDGTRLEVREAHRDGEVSLCISPDMEHNCYGFPHNCNHHQGVDMYAVCRQKGVYFLEVKDE